MPRIEQMVFGRDPGSSQPSRSVLAVSAGLGGDVQSEIVHLCELWGQIPPMGLQHPAVMSYPLTANATSLRGRLFAVIRLTTGLDPIFHAVVLTELDFASFGRNPFAVVATGAFLDTLAPGVRVNSRSIEVGDLTELIAPPPSPSDVGIVDEALYQILSSKHLHLPLEQNSTDSDRSLALLIMALPQSVKRNLRFASYATSTANALTLGAIETNGAGFASWRRYLLAINGGQLDHESAQHVTLIRDCLSVGDMQEIMKAGGKPITVTKRKSERPTKPRADVVTAAFSTTPQPAISTAAAGRTRLQTAGGRASGHRTAAFGPTTAARTLRRVGVRPGSRSAAAPGRLRLLTLLSVVLIGCGYFGWQWAAQRHLVPELALPWNLSQRDGADGGETTLLEVIDVGEVYREQLRHIRGDHGPAPLDGRERRRALAQLQAAVAGPLLKQVKLFTKLSDEGIQQGSRPDRETKRLHFLAGQGTVLADEIRLLELAYYSIDRGADWSDLAGLSDQAVGARSDSLRRTARKNYDRVSEELGTREVRIELKAARDQVAGMAALLRLFQEKRWSAGWEKAVQQAARKVSPAASTMTRAYRNCAFTLVRLKQAEREALSGGWFFQTEFSAEDWLTAEAADILPSFRRQTGKFKADEAPALAAEIVAWYAALEAILTGSVAVADAGPSLTVLEASPLRKFDPAIHEQQLERARYALFNRAVADGMAPADQPDNFFPGGDRTSAGDFQHALQSTLNGEQWAAWAAVCSEPFLAEWAGHLGREAGRREAALLADFVSDYHKWQLTVGKLRVQAASGIDWSAVWGDAYTEGRYVAERYTDVAGFPVEHTDQLEYVADTVRNLIAPLPLQLTSVTVRLDRSVASDGQEISVELKIPTTGEKLQTEVFVLGPAAPAGTGWVGTASVPWELELSPLADLEVVVREGVLGAELLTVSYPSVASESGPGAMTRPREGTNGKITFRMTPSFWNGLALLGPGGI